MRTVARAKMLHVAVALCQLMFPAVQWWFTRWICPAVEMLIKIRPQSSPTRIRDKILSNWRLVSWFLFFFVESELANCPVQALCVPGSLGPLTDVGVTSCRRWWTAGLHWQEQNTSGTHERSKKSDLKFDAWRCRLVTLADVLPLCLLHSGHCWSVRFVFL